jgi:hypothetical protein
MPYSLVETDVAVRRIGALLLSVGVATAALIFLASRPADASVAAGLRLNLEKDGSAGDKCNNDDSCHANELFFDSANALDYIMDKQSVTDGQPFYGIGTDGNKLIVYAGRQKSGAVAADFTKDLTITNVLATNGYFALTPDELNFAIFGTTTFRFPSGGVHICHDLRIAQGSNPTANNW